MASLATMTHLEVPFLNVMTKIDLVGEEAADALIDSPMSRLQVGGAFGQKF